MIDSLPQELPPCPGCGANNWRFQKIPGHAYLVHWLLDAIDKLIVAVFLLFIGSLLILSAPALDELGYLCLGALLIVAPLLAFVQWWLIPKIYQAMEICQECDYIAKAGEIPRAKKP